jgi:hypothetical protein
VKISDNPTRGIFSAKISANPTKLTKFFLGFDLLLKLFLNAVKSFALVRKLRTFLVIEVK